MRDMPSRVRLDPDYNGHQRQVVGWASDVPVDDEHGWTEYVRADLSDALLREAMEALGKLHHAVCGETGFAQCVRDDSKTLYPWPALDVADHAARATLAKLWAHLEGEKE